MTDRGFWVTGFAKPLNVRRLMYQSLIWPAVPRDEPGRLGAPLDAEDLQRLADALVDRVRRNVELGSRSPWTTDAGRRAAGNRAGRQSAGRLAAGFRSAAAGGSRLLSGKPFLSSKANPAPRSTVTTLRAPEFATTLWHRARIRQFPADLRHFRMNLRLGQCRRLGRVAGNGGEGWIRTSVRLRGQIYSLLPLTTRPPLHEVGYAGRARHVAARQECVNALQ